MNHDTVWSIVQDAINDLRRESIEAKRRLSVAETKIDMLEDAAKAKKEQDTIHRQCLYNWLTGAWWAVLTEKILTDDSIGFDVSGNTLEYAMHFQEPLTIIRVMPPGKTDVLFVYRLEGGAVRQFTSLEDAQASLAYRKANL